jgi:hypothetical protein
MKDVIVFIICVFTLQVAQGQNQARGLHFSGFDHFIVGGYVDGGAYLNFTGPSFHYNTLKTKTVVGMLPSLRFKEDKVLPGQPTNPLIMPTLGTGITFSYKYIALQLPFYFNPKTAQQNGRWHVGVGVGICFDYKGR